MTGWGKLPEIDLAVDTWWREPGDTSIAMHEQGAVAAHVPGFDTVSFLRYDDCLAALTDPNLAAMGSRYFRMQGWTSGPFIEWIDSNIVMMNPPDHTRLRRLLSRAFTPRAVSELRDAVAAGARVERAFEILGEDLPEHLREAGTLRLQHKQASLEELGQLADPPLTKDAVAGRIRRLLATADKKAAELGIPDTEAGLTADMLDV